MWIVEEKLVRRDLELRPIKVTTRIPVEKRLKPRRWEFATREEAESFAKTVDCRVTIYQLERMGT